MNGVTIVNAFQSILNSSKRKLNKIWVNQGSKQYFGLINLIKAVLLKYV